MKKVLIITPYYPPFPRVGAVRRVENFARYLPDLGWEPVVLTMDWGYGAPDRATTPKVYPTWNLAALSWNAYRSTEVAAVRSWKKSVSSFFIGIVRFLKNYLLLPDELILWVFWVLPRLRKIVAAERPDALFVNAPPFSTLLIGLLAKRLTGLPLVSDVRDDWIDNPLTEKKNRFLHWLERGMERSVVKHSDRVIVVTPASHAAWSRRYPLWKDKLVMIPNGYYEEEFANTAAFRYDDFALVHTGSLEAGRSPELLFRAMAAIGAGSKNIRFHQYGLTIKSYKTLASRHGLTDVVQFEDIISGKEAIARIKGASVLVLIPTDNAPTAIPGKAYEYLRSGRPIILISPRNATTDFLVRFPQVHHVLPDDEAGCRSILARLAAATAPAEDRRQQELLKRYDRKALTGDLAVLLTAITGDRT